MVYKYKDLDFEMNTNGMLYISKENQNTGERDKKKTNRPYQTL